MQYDINDAVKKINAKCRENYTSFIKNPGNYNDYEFDEAISELDGMQMLADVLFEDRGDYGTIYDAIGEMRDKVVRSKDKCYGSADENE